MKDKNYKDLCNACDDVLLEGELSETRLAISWLHILKSESTYLNRYQALFSALNSTFKRYTPLEIFLKSIPSCFFLKKIVLPLKENKLKD